MDAYRGVIIGRLGKDHKRPAILPQDLFDI